MTVYSLFAAPVLAMRSQSHALNVVGVNLANVNTGGFKATEARFSTLLAQQFDHNMDIGGVKPVDFQRIDSQGTLLASARDLDVAINGQGFFIMNSELDGSGRTSYGRDGSFQLGIAGAGTGTLQTSTVTGIGGLPLTINEGFLADKNGNFVQGFSVGIDGTVGTTLESLRIDQFAFASVSEATTVAELILNIPAGNAFSTTESFGIDLIDSNGLKQSAFLDFQKGDFTVAPPDTSTLNQWTMSVRTDAGSTTPALLNFTQNGTLSSPLSSTFAVTWASGGTASVAFDLSGMTQFDGDLVAFKFEKNGFQASEISRLQFDEDGFIVGSFQDGDNRKIYRVPLAIFANPNGLLEQNGNTFIESQFSGQRSVVVAGANGFAQFAVNTIELSNVNMAQEFSNMILAQNAYNLSATTLRTVDEMTEVARDLKR
jgi:flagellar hook protein FlgE